MTRWRVVFHLHDGSLRAGVYDTDRALEQVLAGLASGRVAAWDLVALPPVMEPGR